jgi:SAM-dependent MidA family methyltransferase
MAADRPDLTALLRARIAAEGPLAFGAFMGEALYHPQSGYYSQPSRSIGRGGDFYTSVSSGPLFGSLLADTFASCWEVLGRPSPWTVVEQGAHDGRFAADALAALATRHPEARAALRWNFVEDRPAWRAAQAATLEAAGQGAAATWNQPASPALPGVFFSNELADALPFDIVVRRGPAWRERRVGWAGGRFIWAEIPAAPALAARADSLDIPHLEGYVAEVPTAALAWAADWTRWVEQGFSLTIDYGADGPNLYTPERAEGTFRAFHRHAVSDDVLAEPGSRDITAHVNFSALARAAADGGWEVLGWCDQHRFLTAAAETGGWLAAMERALTPSPPAPAAAAQLRQFRTLSHPGIMGRAFHVLLMGHGVPPGCAGAVHGLKYRRPLPR